MKREENYGLMPLKACPCCLGKAKKMFCDASGKYYFETNEKPYQGRILNYYMIQCQKCGLKTKQYKTDRGAFNAWNRRPTDEERFIYGYPANELYSFARACKANDVSEEDIHDFCKNLDFAFSCAKNEWEQSFQNFIEQLKEHAEQQKR